MYETCAQGEKECLPRPKSSLPLYQGGKGFKQGRRLFRTEKNFGPLPAAPRLTAECRDIPVSTNSAERNLGLFGPSKIAKARLLRSESHAWWVEASVQYGCMAPHTKAEIGGGATA